MRVMLMVQDDRYDKRPKFWCNWTAAIPPGPVERDYCARFKSWWLVEAESANEARRAIARFEDGHRDGTHGTVIAQGGRS